MWDKCFHPEVWLGYDLEPIQLTLDFKTKLDRFSK
jgi:hypothetical protein